MTTEQRLVAALEASRGYEPSPDLWTRVVHSIEEDRRHRRRVAAAAAAVLTTLVVVCAVAVLSLESTSAGARIEWRVMEAIELVVAGALVVSLGPAIRRFGRSFAEDLFTHDAATGRRLLSLIDVAYYLVFSGYAFMTTRLAPPEAYEQFLAGSQLREATIRTGGLLLAMGVLHAVALAALPMVAFVYNTTRTGRKLPRWVVVVLVIAAFQAVSGLPGIFLLGLGE